MPIITDVVKCRDREDVPLTNTHLRSKNRTEGQERRGKLNWLKGALTLL